MTANPTGLALGVDVGGTKIFGVVVDDQQRILNELRIPTVQGGMRDWGEAVTEEIAVVIHSLHHEAGLAIGSLPICVGVPGMVDAAGTLIYAPNLQSATQAPMLTQLQRQFPDVAIRIENDANCAAYCEFRAGAGRGHDDMTMITLGTGIGGGIIAGGRPFRGGRGFAGEFGHMVMDPKGPHCPCGASGCWERYVSGSAVERMTAEALIQGRLDTIVAQRANKSVALTGEEVSAAALAGNREARALLEPMASWLARGIAVLATVLDPTCVVIGGGLTDVMKLFLPEVRDLLPTLLEGGVLHPGIDVVPAFFGESAGAIGASMLAREEG